ncbi:monooxygenase [Epithele typhae]|uniref:monooxygenase n=1 Tax=Epithele typhae TaxID=378194 RepID=UPI002008B552|nr:monooxygenase [Epithele typhae]KAH9939104.1 monooxygenase [Epithele typhae]
MSPSTMNSPNIAIIGGGLGGLVLLLTLSRRGVPATLYERDANANVRAHFGGTLDLGWTNGQRALRENGLEDAFKTNSRPEGEEMRIYDASGKLHFHNEGHGEDGGPAPPERTRPEIDRTVLRKLLLDACPPDSIKWDHALTSATPLGDGKHSLAFSNGFTTTCDILVGADGANSRVRPLVSPATPFYSGVNGAEISLTPTVAASPELADPVAAVGKGSAFVMGENKLFASQVNGDGRLRTYTLVRAPADWTLPTDPAEARATLLALYDGFVPWARKLVEHADPAAMYQRAMYVLKPGHKWTHRTGVTLIGDAAHLMTPFAGAGANLAMLDGLELALVLVEEIGRGAEGDVDAGITRVEENMCAMAGRVSQQSWDNLHAFVNEKAPQSALDRFAELMAGPEREG